MEKKDIFSEGIFSCFARICEIPRESGNEKKISDYIKYMAEEKGCVCMQDERNHNLMVKVSGSKGYENSDPVILQAHMDMVCEKDPSGNHNFETDPIRIGVDGDWIVSEGGTTLGADNGIGVAAMLAILEDESIKHPPLEMAFTVCEETTFEGAESFPAEWITAKKMINLDHAADNEIIAGSCGGVGAAVTIPMDSEECPKGMKPFSITIEGMKGGHSGEDIHRGRGNAILLLFRLIDNEELRLVSVTAGTSRLALPRNAEAIVLAKDSNTVQKLASEMEQTIIREYGELASQMKITVECLSENVKPLTKESSLKALRFVKLVPNGIVNMNGAFDGIVESSCNMGVLNIANGKLEAVCEARGQYQTTVDDIAEKISLLAEMMDGKVEFFAAYAPWEYEHESELRSFACKIYNELFNGMPEVITLHAGLECGMFAEKTDGLDIMSIGPNCEYFHSINERVSISSTRKFYKFLIAMLEKMK